MMTVSEVSRLTGVSARTLRYYDRLGLLKPSEVSAAGYRRYDEAALERLQQVLLFRELEFPLKEIKAILDAPGFDRTRALGQQIELLTLKKEHLESLITLATGIKMLGVRQLDFSAFDTRKIDDYVHRAKESWGENEAYKEFERRQKGRSREDDKRAEAQMTAILQEFGKLIGEDAGGPAARALVKRLKATIDEHYYTCTPEILRALGKMYAGDGEFTANIDGMGGPGTAAFAAEAVRLYCDSL